MSMRAFPQKGGSWAIWTSVRQSPRTQRWSDGQERSCVQEALEEVWTRVGRERTEEEEAGAQTKQGKSLEGVQERLRAPQKVSPPI